ncbi:zinc ribbon domain-containing protein [Chitinophaga sp. Cy-1792]|uniref:zinc ribbon domain-containing protein n=1 Tax=Chitinophaga sp. Cy-1792 TaxID=2608339 RepID=UPI00142475CF|nr:zinc ribbon domain-containing protein [Chitinophaga sp. Cy-1792]NIG57012.1 zinc ribbon domain-containing protein [Chitinophaga sp. Cy-1792]
MKYLLCSHCEHPNALKSEYQTFCESCGKKLPHNFAEWRQAHPMASFEEFRQTIGIYIKPKKTNVVAAWAQRQLQPQNRGKVIIFFTLLFVCIATAGTLFGKKAVYTLLYPKVAKSSLYGNWTTATIGRQALEISTPLKLWVHDQPLGPAEAGLTEYAKSYRNEDGGGVQIEVNLRTYKNAEQNTLDIAVKQTNACLLENGQVTDMNYNPVAVLISGMPGTLEEGTYTYKKAIKLAFSNLVVVKGNSRWQIHINYRDDDPNGQEVARRVLKSVKIK